MASVYRLGPLPPFPRSLVKAARIPAGADGNKMLLQQLKGIDARARLREVSGTEEFKNQSLPHRCKGRQRLCALRQNRLFTRGRASRLKEGRQFRDS